jgi:hypothetical protein
VASGGALDMLHQAMLRLLLHRTIRMAIKMTRDGGTFVRNRRFCHCS